MMFYSAEGGDPGRPNMTGRLYLYSDDIMALYDRIKDKVKVCQIPEVRFYGMKEFAIEDNNGYVLAFGQDINEPSTCKESFATSSLLTPPAAARPPYAAAAPEGLAKARR